MSFAILRHLSFPTEVDSNSPSFWDGETFYLFNSAGNLPKRSSGVDLENLGDPSPIRFNNPSIRVNRWIEAVWKTPDGVLWGWRHAEPWDSVCSETSVLGRTLTAPQIGAAASFDNGLNWIDLGIVLRANINSIRCNTENGYFSGGVGDFSVMLDANEQYLYFLFGTYSGDVREQGVSMARMAWQDRYFPVGRVWRWFEEGWNSAGIDGASTTSFPAKVDWHLKDADVFWGPSIHWNTYLARYVALLNRTKNANFGSEGIYISYSTDLSDPASWTDPQKILGEGNWYPQVVGSSMDKGTDKLAGKTARLFIARQSDYEIEFEDLTSCALSATKEDGVVGEAILFNVTSQPAGFPAFWNGTKDGVIDAVDIPIGITNLFGIDYGPLKENLIPIGAARTTYTRYITVQDFEGRVICKSNTLTLTLRRRAIAPPGQEGWLRDQEDFAKRP